MVDTTRAADEKGLRDRRKAEQFKFFEAVAYEVGFVPIEAILTVATFTPTASINHAPGIRCL